MNNLSQPQKSKKLFKLTEKLKEACWNNNLIDWTIAEMLYEVKKKKLYRYWDIAEKPNFNTWIANSEIPITRNKTNHWIRLYKQYIVERKYDIKDIADITPRKLLMLLPLKDRIDGEWLDMARVLSQTDLQYNINEELGKKVCDHTGYTAKEKKIIVKCTRCDKILKDD